MLWVLRSGAHWCDLPERYGKWKTVHQRFSRWFHAGVWEWVFQALTAGRDNAYLMIDSTIVRAHQQAATGKGGACDQALGRSRGGLTTKIHMLADALGRPIRFIITAGQVGDITQAPACSKIRRRAVLADKAYDSKALRACIATMRAEAVIPIDPLSQSRHLKHFRRFATRYDRRTIHFIGFVHLATAMTWLR